jgi:hypothetical protein
VFRFNFRYEYGDIVAATSTGDTDADLETISRRSLHCSALIKVVDDELFFAHTMWWTYQVMVRQYKSYEGRNPRSGATVHVAPKRLPFFKVGKELRERVNEALKEQLAARQAEVGQDRGSVAKEGAAAPAAPGTTPPSPRI